MKRILTAIALSSTLVAPLATPVAAGGVFTFNLEARNADEANAIRAGLTLYKVAKDIEANGHISQSGMNNIASLAQGGSGNIGVIHQDGNGHNASLNQGGGNNSCGVFQFGENANAHVTQSGGEACIVIQAGF